MALCHFSFKDRSHQLGTSKCRGPCVTFFYVIVSVQVDLHEKKINSDLLDESCFHHLISEASLSLSPFLSTTLPERRSCLSSASTSHHIFLSDGSLSFFVWQQRSNSCAGFEPSSSRWRELDTVNLRVPCVRETGIEGLVGRSYLFFGRFMQQRRASSLWRERKRVTHVWREGKRDSASFWRRSAEAFFFFVCLGKLCNLSADRPSR